MEYSMEGNATLKGLMKALSMKIISFILIFFTAINISCMDPEITPNLSIENGGISQALEIAPLAPFSLMSDEEVNPLDLPCSRKFNISKKL